MEKNKLYVGIGLIIVAGILVWSDSFSLNKCNCPSDEKTICFPSKVKGRTICKCTDGAMEFTTLCNSKIGQV